jgi:hypothetical protein
MRYAVLLLAVLLASCASSNQSTSRGIKEQYVTTYYDRNHDGGVDFELHDILGAADAAWALSDTEFRGRHDVRVKFGYAFERGRVDLPVPKNVKVTPGRRRCLPPNEV